MPAHDPYAALRVPNFRLFIASLLVLTIGVQIQGVVVAWQIYEVTRDPLSLGLIGLAEALPFIATALYAGHVADRSNRRQVTRASIAVLFACSACGAGAQAIGADRGVAGSGVDASRRGGASAVRCDCLIPVAPGLSLAPGSEPARAGPRRPRDVSADGRSASRASTRLTRCRQRRRAHEN